MPNGPIIWNFVTGSIGGFLQSLIARVLKVTVFALIAAALLWRMNMMPKLSALRQASRLPPRGAASKWNVSRALLCVANWWLMILFAVPGAHNWLEKFNDTALMRAGQVPPGAA